jgi:CheY-like chemotaxis protein
MGGGGTPSFGEFYPDFKVYHELMRVKVREILLVSSPYEAFIMEEDRSLASRIITEYSGLNLSLPPRVTRTPSVEKALEGLDAKPFDLVLTMPHLDETDGCALGRTIKTRRPDLPVILLANSQRSLDLLPEGHRCSGVDKTFIWTGNSDLLLAIVKNVEDGLNVDADTRKAQVRVLILVEDSPAYYSSILPLIYKEIVRQTQAVLGSGLNEEHRLLKMRARPKILHARSYEEGLSHYERFRPYIFGVLSAARLPREGRQSAEAGCELLERIRSEDPDLPLLLLSASPANRGRADRVPAAFLDKNEPNLLGEIRDFFLRHLGFGDFVFRLPDGDEVARASDLRTLEETVATIPEASLRYHAERNHFSNWLMARSEISLGSTFRSVRADDFSDAETMRSYIVSSLRALRKWRQKGVVALYSERLFDADVTEFVKVGNGSLGGKARGLAFMSALLQQHSGLVESFPDVTIRIPKTLVLTTEGFEAFVAANGLEGIEHGGHSDREVAERFLAAEMPAWHLEVLQHFLGQVRHPLSVRSSSLLEDAHFQPYAGLYATYMIPNNHPDPAVRLVQLLDAVKLVYASTRMEGPRAYARSTSARPQEEAMAVVIQELAGERYGDFFYPAISGVAQSHNYYPIGPMRPEDGIAHIALGIGKTVVEGERALRFCPRYPGVLPQFSTVDDILAHSQQTFYALEMAGYPERLPADPALNLAKRALEDAESEHPVRLLASTYLAEDHRIRDSGFLSGPKVLTFAPVLKFDAFPLAGILSTLLSMGRGAMGSPVEIEFAVNLGSRERPRREFLFLQMRPVAAGSDRTPVEIAADEVGEALCFSEQVLGNGRFEGIGDVVFIEPAAFRVESTRRMAEEIGRVNARLTEEKRPYLLVGPGRWGSADPWLGVPVRWHQISGVEAIVEIRGEALNAEPSQGSHFFQNITAIGIPYLTVGERSGGWLDWERLAAMPTVEKGGFVRHVRPREPLTLKVDGRRSRAVILAP